MDAVDMLALAAATAAAAAAGRLDGFVASIGEMDEFVDSTLEGKNSPPDPSPSLLNRLFSSCFWALEQASN